MWNTKTATQTNDSFAVREKEREKEKEKEKEKEEEEEKEKEKEREWEGVGLKRAGEVSEWKRETSSDVSSLLLPGNYCHLIQGEERVSINTVCVTACKTALIAGDVRGQVCVCV